MKEKAEYLAEVAKHILAGQRTPRTSSARKIASRLHGHPCHHDIVETLAQREGLAGIDDDEDDENTAWYRFYDGSVMGLEYLTDKSLFCRVNYEPEHFEPRS